MCSDTGHSDGTKDREGKCRSEGEGEGKIKGRGTRRGVCPGLHVGWRGTRLGWRGAVLGEKVKREKRLGRASSHRLRWDPPNGAI